MRQTRVVIADCLSHTVYQNIAEDNETLNLHVSCSEEFQGISFFYNYEAQKLTMFT